VAITGSEDLGISIMITEGFGNIPIADRTFDLLTKHIGKFGSINGSTQIRAGVIRPEVLIPLDDSQASTVDFNEDDLIISEGSQVRVVRDPFFGEVGHVISLPPELLEMESETKVRVAEVKFLNGEIKIIPRANLEMILSDK
jgi:transcription antitermination factor NusG